MAASSKSEERREPTMESARALRQVAQEKTQGSEAFAVRPRRLLVAGARPVVLHRRDRRDRLGRRAPAADPVARSAEAPAEIQIVGLNGRVLATRGEMGGSAVPLRELPAFLPKAFLAIEDRRFYSHYGIDPFGVVRAVGANVMRRGVSQGGSTITQQLAKNLFLTQERTMQRKLQEVILALWLERKFTKDEILDLYLNRVYFGSGAYGVEAAAQRYFGKSARNITLSEAALLAGLVKSPSKLAPTRNFDGAERRAQIVLAAMADASYITADAAKAAIASAPKSSSRARAARSITSPTG